MNERGKAGVQVHRHPHHVGNEPQETVGEEQGGLVQDAERVHALGDPGAEEFQLPREIDRALVEHLADEVAIKAEQDSRRHRDQQGGNARDGSHGAPRRPLDMDVQRHRHGRHHHRMLLRQHRRRIGHDGAGIPGGPAARQAAHEAPARQHCEERGHDDGALHEVGHRVHRHGVDREERHAHAHGGKPRCAEMRLGLEFLGEACVREQVAHEGHRVPPRCPGAGRCSRGAASTIRRRPGRPPRRSCRRTAGAA